MLAKSLEKIMLEKKEMLIISAKSVANLQTNNPLNHALLVLSQVHFSKIPVLGVDDRFVGTVGLAEVVDKMIEMQAKGIQNLQDFTVMDVVDIDQPTIGENWTLDEAMRLLKDYNFVPVVDEERSFVGILTRKGLLSAINHTFHEFEKHNIVIPKIGNVVSKKIGAKSLVYSDKKRVKK
ncbi:MAG: CBS domain-containing protein [Lactobacillales bacterium]|jgi:predicted transcriptional regulator|nr:CBS domain-containing protein [Lactobacillales bacterium]